MTFALKVLDAIALGSKALRPHIRVVKPQLLDDLTIENGNEKSHASPILSHTVLFSEDALPGLKLDSSIAVGVGQKIQDSRPILSHLIFLVLYMDSRTTTLPTKLERQGVAKGLH